jgi:hypothetical protein
LWTSLLFGAWHVLRTIEHYQGNPASTLVADSGKGPWLAVAATMLSTTGAGGVFAWLQLVHDDRSAMGLEAGSGCPTTTWVGAPFAPGYIEAARHRLRYAISQLHRLQKLLIKHDMSNSWQARRDCLDGVFMPSVCLYQGSRVIAAQTDTPQADVPPIHDHTIQAAPGDPGWTAFMHGYFVICSAEGLTSGDCVAVFTQFPGFGTLLAESVNGEPLTSAETIEAGIDAGLLVAVDTGAVFIGTVSPAR